MVRLVSWVTSNYFQIQIKSVGQNTRLTDLSVSRKHRYSFPFTGLLPVKGQSWCMDSKAQEGQI